MACERLSSGRCRSTCHNIGGIKGVWMANIEDVDFSTMTETSGEITELELETGTGIAWFYFQPNKYSSNWTDEAQSGDNGLTGWLQTLNLVFSKNETALRDTVNELAQSEVIAIVENADGTMWYLGEEGNGLLTTTATSNSGTAASDLNGWTLALTSTCSEPAKVVNPGAESDLKTALTSAKNC